MQLSSRDAVHASTAGAGSSRSLISAVPWNACTKPGKPSAAPRVLRKPLLHQATKLDTSTAPSVAVASAAPAHTAAIVAAAAAAPAAPAAAALALVPLTSAVGTGPKVRAWTVIRASSRD